MKKFTLKLRSLIIIVIINFQRWRNYLIGAVMGTPPLYKSQITEHLFLGGQYSRSGLNTLKKWGVTAVVSMRLIKPKEYSFFSSLKVLHLPTPDRKAPSLSQLKEGVAFITGEIEKGGKVYVHCMWGEGRGPTMAIAYLVSTGMTVDDAINIVKGVRTFIRLTKVQKARLEEYSREIAPKVIKEPIGKI